MNGTIYFCSQEHGHFVLQTSPSGNEKGEGEKRQQNWRKQSLLQLKILVQIKEPYIIFNITGLKRMVSII